MGRVVGDGFVSVSAGKDGLWRRGSDLPEHSIGCSARGSCATPAPIPLLPKDDDLARPEVPCGPARSWIGCWSSDGRVGRVVMPAGLNLVDDLSNIVVRDGDHQPSAVIAEPDVLVARGIEYPAT